MLVGIRPAKLALELLDAGKSPMTVRRHLRHEYLVNPKKAALCIDVAQNERAILELAPEDTCSLYISIPFCPSKCTYCSFVSYSTNRLLSMIPDYVERLCRDVESAARQIKRAGKRLVTIYIGGGTPTVLTESELERLTMDLVWCCLFMLTTPFPHPSSPKKIMKQEGGGRWGGNMNYLSCIKML